MIYDNLFVCSDQFINVLNDREPILNCFKKKVKLLLNSLHCTNALPKFQKLRSIYKK